MYIKDLQSGEVRKYGSNHHDALRVSPDGTILSYENLQNGDGSRFGDYRFCDEDGLIPEEDEVLVKHGADAYFNIGGFVEVVRCKDCKYRNIFRHESEMGDSFDEYCRWHPNESPDDDDYCSYGERGEQE